MQREECIICFNSQYSDNPDSSKRFYSTPCNHHFHFKCFKRWCQINNSCPTCRRNIIMNLSNNNENYDDYYPDGYFTHERFSYLIRPIISSPPSPSPPPPSPPPPSSPPPSSSPSSLPHHTSNDNDYHYSNTYVISQESSHNNNFNMINIDNVLDNMRNDYNDTGVVSANNLSEYHRTFGYSTISRLSLIHI